MTPAGAEMPWPDLGSFEPPVAEALRAGRQELEQALGAAPSERDTGIAYGELGRLYLAHHLMYAAEAAFSRAVAYDPNEFLWNYLLGYAQQEQGKPAEAVRWYRKALLIDPSYSAAAFRLAQSELSDGRESAAKKSLVSLLSRQPEHIAALAGLARIAIRQRDYQRAIALLGRALRLNPAANQLHYPLAQALRQAGQMEAAKKQLALAGQTRPPVADPVLAAVESLSRSSQLYLERGLALLRAGRYADAGTHYQLLAAADNGIAVFWYRLALANLAQRDCAGALVALDRVLAISPADGGLLLVLARAYSICPGVSARQRQRALELAHLVHDARPGVDTLETLAMASAANRRFEDAQAFQAQAILRLRQTPGVGGERRIDHLRAALARYENGQPAVIAFSPGDPVMNPQVRRR